MLNGLFTSRTREGWLAVWLGEGRGRFAHVKPGKRPAVVSLVEREWNAQAPKEFERVRKQLGARAHRCTTVLTATEYQMLQVEAPNVKREELKSAVRWRIKDMIDYHVDDATIDVLDIPAHAAPQRSATMYVVAARSDTVKRLMEQFDAAGLPLAVIDIPDTCQRNIAALYESPGRALLSMSFDERGGLMTITSGGELYLSRRLDIGYEQLDDGADKSARAMERVQVELQRSLDHFERNFSSLPVERILVAPMPHAESLVGRLSGQIQLPVLPMDLAEVMDLPPQYVADPPDARARWFRLIGAGLRVERAAL